jgi:hypothetical protein
VRLEGLDQLRNRMNSSGIDSATLRLVEQSLNHFPPIQNKSKIEVFCRAILFFVVVDSKRFKLNCSKYSLI